MITLQDYQQTLHAFTQKISELDDALLATFLYGSMARGDIVLGHSDLDFWVFVRQSVLADETQFKQVLSHMAECAKLLAQSGLPVFHAFCYYAEDEAQLLPSALVPNLQQEQSSRVIVGEDIRAQLGATAVSRTTHKAAYFAEMRFHIFHPLTPFIYKPDLSQKECGWVLGALKYIKYVAEAACVACDVWCGEQEALTQLGQLLPTIDASIIQQIEAFRTGPNPTDDPKKVHEMLLLALNFVEDVHTALNDRAPAIKE